MLKPKQMQAVELLALGFTREETAKRVGVGERTLYLWLQQAEFQQALRDVQAEQWRALLGRLGRLTGEAVDALQRALRDAPHAVQVRAADVLLGKLVAVKQVHELEQRLAALERELERIREVKHEVTSLEA